VIGSARNRKTAAQSSQYTPEQKRVRRKRNGVGTHKRHLASRSSSRRGNTHLIVVLLRRAENSCSVALSVSSGVLWLSIIDVERLACGRFPQIVSKQVLKGATELSPKAQDAKRWRSRWERSSSRWWPRKLTVAVSRSTRK
jgi:hypothetical protein